MDGGDVRRVIITNGGCEFLMICYRWCVSLVRVSGEGQQHQLNGFVPEQVSQWGCGHCSGLARDSEGRGFSGGEGRGGPGRDKGAEATPEWLEIYGWG